MNINQKEKILTKDYFPLVHQYLRPNFNIKYQVMFSIMLLNKSLNFFVIEASKPKS